MVETNMMQHEGRKTESRGSQLIQCESRKKKRGKIGNRDSNFESELLVHKHRFQCPSPFHELCNTLPFLTRRKREKLFSQKTFPHSDHSVIVFEKSSLPR